MKLHWVVFLSAACALTARADDVIDSSLLLRHNFDAAPVGGVILDTSPAGGHPGTNVGTAWVASAGGRVGVQQFVFRDINRITTPVDEAFNSPTGTICFWMKSTTVGGANLHDAMMMDHRTSSGGGDVITLTENGVVSVQATSITGVKNSFAGYRWLCDGLWHHIAYLYDQGAGGSTTLYVDGTLENQGFSTDVWNWPTNQPIMLGSSWDGWWNKFDGQLDDFLVYNRILSEAEIQAATNGTPVIDVSLVLRYNFDAAPVNDLVVDGSLGGTRPGTNQAAIWLASDTGRSGVMSFATPQSDHIMTEPSPDLDVTQGTIAFWFNTSTPGTGNGHNRLLFDRRSNVGDVITMDQNGRIFLQPSGYGAGFTSTGGSFADGQWHHLAYVYDQAASIKLYLDGAPNATFTATGWTWDSTRPLQVGSSPDTWWPPYVGYIDDFRFYNRMLSDAEVATIIPPTLKFTLNPESQTSFAGDTVVMMAEANLPSTYAWTLNGTNTLAGATGTVLMLTNIQSSDAGTYRVIATGASGVVTSTPALLIVNPRPALSASLKARYNFDAAPVGDVVIDTAIAGSHPGTNVGAVWIAEDTGRTGIMEFSTANGSQIGIAGHADFEAPKGTIAFWMKSLVPGSPGGRDAMLFDHRGPSGDVISLTDAGVVSAQAVYPSGNVVNQLADTNSLTDGVWHHVALVYDQSLSQTETVLGGHQFYVDGKPGVMKLNSGVWQWVAGQPVLLGKSWDSWWNVYDGVLDDVQIYDRQLSAAEIVQAMAMPPLGPKLVFSVVGTDLKLSWTGDGFMLQENPDLKNAAGWTDVAGGGTSPVTVSVATGQKFYRLKK